MWEYKRRLTVSRSSRDTALQDVACYWSRSINPGLVGGEGNDWAEAEKECDEDCANRSEHEEVQVSSTTENQDIEPLFK